MAASAYFFRIIASNGIIFEGKIRTVIFNTIDGQLEIQAHHEEMVIAVELGSLRFQLPDGEWQKYIVGIGTAQVANNRCTVLVDTCEKPEDIDRNRAMAALERAKEQLRQKRSIEEYKMSKASMARALTRLKEAYKE